MIRGHLKIVVMNLLDRRSMSGYVLMNEVKEIIGSKPSPGSMYPLLDSLSRDGHVTIEMQGRKKIYSLSKQGRKLLLMINKKKDKIIERLSEGIKIFESMDHGKETEFFKMFLNEMKMGKLPLNHLNPELMEFRTALFPFLISKNNKNRVKIKKIIKESTKKIKELQ
ncbi:MAG: PadR family transcriptional regulator [Nanoarchaeota archaeon]|nr:PadR family transcriptional regulator [Nanoarchaeota archaeon]